MDKTPVFTPSGEIINATNIPFLTDATIPLSSVAVFMAVFLHPTFKKTFKKRRTKKRGGGESPLRGLEAIRVQFEPGVHFSLYSLYFQPLALCALLFLHSYREYAVVERRLRCLRVNLSRQRETLVVFPVRQLG